MILSTGLYRVKLKEPIIKECFDAAAGKIEDVSKFADTDEGGFTALH